MERVLLAVANKADADFPAIGVSDDIIELYGAMLGQYFVLDVTALTGTTPSLQLIVEMKDQKSGKYIALLTAVAVSATGTTTYLLATGAQAAAEGVTLVRGFPPPLSYRVRVVKGGTITNCSFTVTGKRS